jgi:hypothetical protein
MIAQVCKYITTTTTINPSEIDLVSGGAAWSGKIFFIST